MRQSSFDLARWIVAVMRFWMYKAGREDGGSALKVARSCACSCNESSSLATVTSSFLILASVAAEAAELEEANGIAAPDVGRPRLAVAIEEERLQRTA